MALTSIQSIALTPEQTADFIKTRKMVIEGVELTDENLQVSRYFDDAQSSQYEASFDREAVVIMDIIMDKTLIEEGLAREIMNRIQRLRKKAGLVQTDSVEYYYRLEKDVDDQLVSAFESQKEFLLKSLKQPLNAYADLSKDKKVVIEEVQEVNGSTFLVCFTEV